MKIITLCGSLKFKKEMMEIAEKMALLGNCILTPIYPIIELSDAILVVNVNNYIGDSTSLEIEYAKKLEKKVIYYTELLRKN